jgi:hypothetical protein
MAKKRPSAGCSTAHPVDAYGESLKPDVVLGVRALRRAQRARLNAWHEVASSYNKTVNIEAQLMVPMSGRASCRRPTASRASWRRRWRRWRPAHGEGVAQGSGRGDQLTDACRIRP